MMNKIQKISKVIEKVLSVLFWVIVGFCALTVIVFISLVAFGHADIAEQYVYLGDYKLTLVEGFSYNEKPVVVLSVIGIVLGVAFACYAISVLKKIFHPMALGLPFGGSVSRSIRKLAWVELVFGIAGTALRMISETVMQRAMDIPSLFSPDKVSACSVSVTSDLGFLGAFVFLLLLSHVFQYGEELQKLSDETL